MDWLLNNTFINRQQPRALLGPDEECDPVACFVSFKEHWLQAHKIILRSQQLPSHDDVLGVVNHLEQMVTLVLYDIKKNDDFSLPVSTSRCLEHLLAENILEKLYEWGIRTGKYTNAVRLELIKFYEMLVTHSRHALLAHEPFLKPLRKLLISCQSEVFPRDIEKRLVQLIYQLCVLLMQNPDLINLFSIEDKGVHKFILFSLLVPFVHRDDSTGMQARDALLLCMSLSKKNKLISIFIKEHSNICVLLASGLSGLYSVLPPILTDISVPDWHRLTPDDVNDIKDLSTFVTSLEFCNAVAQVAHTSIKCQLQEFFIRGFLIPVLGPALLQSAIGEQVAATTYLELILRSSTHPGLLLSVIQFLITMEYDGQRLMNILIQRLCADKQLCLVSLALFDTLIDNNCEDIMLELCFQHLQPCLHLMLSQRKTLLPLDPHCQSFEKFLSLSPSCCETTILNPSIDVSNIYWNYYGSQQSLYGNYHAYLCDARNKISSCQFACDQWRGSYTGCDSPNHESNTVAEENINSFPSLGESSGYESLKIKLEEGNDDNEVCEWQISKSIFNETKQTYFNDRSVTDNNCDHLNASGSAGPFLTILLNKLNNFLSNSFYINLHLTGLISRLAVYPQPLLRTYLLDHSLVLQPNVPSLFLIIGSLKQKIDEYMNKQSECANLIKYARNFLLERETRLVNARKNAVDKHSITSTQSCDNFDSFQRNGPKRRSLNLSSISNMFGRRPSQVEQTNIPLATTTEESQVIVMYPKFNEQQHVALCAVLLDEWIKELAALAQEHAIAQLATLLK